MKCRCCGKEIPDNEDDDICYECGLEEADLFDEYWI